MNFIDAYNDSNLAVITMQHSSWGNRLNKKNLEDLYQAIYTSIKDPEVRALLLRSNGSRFCLGMDLNYLQDVRKDKKRIEKAIELYTDVLSTIYKSPKPVIALIEGEVKAGGIGLIAACDIVIASENSSFALSEVLLGLIPANVLPYLLCLRIPPQKAKYLILTAKKISAREAEILNLVDEVFGLGFDGAGVFFFSGSSTTSASPTGVPFPDSLGSTDGSGAESLLTAPSKAAGRAILVLMYSNSCGP